MEEQGWLRMQKIDTDCNSNDEFEKFRSNFSVAKLWLCFALIMKFLIFYWEWKLRPDYMSRAASVYRDDFLPGITWGEPARLMADAMNHRRPERAWFWCDEELMSRAGPANAITLKNLSSVSRDPGTTIPGSRLTGPLRCFVFHSRWEFQTFWKLYSKVFSERNKVDFIRAQNTPYFSWDFDFKIRYRAR